MIPRFDPVYFWNSLFDKGLLTLVVLLAAHLGNRYLERYRSERALITEAAKLRLAHIGALWEELLLWERDSGRLFIEFCAIALAALREADVAGVPQETDAEHEGSVKILMNLPNLEIPQGVQERLSAQFSPRSGELAERAKEITRQIDRNRFWLGDELFEAMKRYHLEMQKTMVLLAPNRDAMRQFKIAYAELGKTRDDADRVLARLLGRKPA